MRSPQASRAASGWRVAKRTLTTTMRPSIHNAKDGGYHIVKAVSNCLLTISKLSSPWTADPIPLITGNSSLPRGNSEVSSLHPHQQLHTKTFKINCLGASQEVVTPPLPVRDETVKMSGPQGSPPSPIPSLSSLTFTIPTNISPSTSTFGIELECYIGFLPCFSPPDPRWATTTFEPNGSGTIEQPIFTHVRATLRSMGLPQRWLVTKDYSLSRGLAGPEDWKWIGIEVISPVLTMEGGGLEEAKRVVAVLNRTYRITHDRNTGFHVHVGYGRNGFTIRTLRNLMATLWTFEGVIETIHPANRRNDQNSFCLSLQGRSFLSYNMPPTANSARDGLEAIFAAETQNDILNMFVRGAALGYNLMNLRPLPEELEKRTIEFRQHEGTVSVDAVLNWVRFCVGIVKFAGRVEDGELAAFLRAHVDGGTDFSIEDLLAVMGIPEQAVYYGDVANRRERGLPLLEVGDDVKMSGNTSLPEAHMDDRNLNEWAAQPGGASSQNQQSNSDNGSDGFGGVELDDDDMKDLGIDENDLPYFGIKRDDPELYARSRAMPSSGPAS
ncbi:putative amidoligase enzyme-domain-containing protein [Amylocarpus encephaloides]|uniref:Amidoligase enzyme-domain-containing protein n=1 Tax=Amylocarpus encephaloides TaxID=45428 RepID=A0A9P7Y8S5_9HELO|nr:putative amidoligase enzyme-domain-containing protein [Amylocarpus encephaloides]